MGSLTNCLKKLGDTVSAADKKLVIEASRRLRKDGMSVSEAPARAVRDLMSTLLGEMNSLKSDVSFSRREQTETPDFKRWFGASKIVDSDGKPRVMYHGTARDITVFKPKQAGAIFLTDNPGFAGTFAEASAEWIAKHESVGKPTPDAVAHVMRRINEEYRGPEWTREREHLLLEAKRWQDGNGKPTGEVADFLREVAGPSGQNLMPLYVKAENPFDYRNQRHRRALIQHLLTGEHAVPSGAVELALSDGETGKPPLYTAKLLDRILSDESVGASNWSLIEHPEVQEAIKALGHDSFYVQEAGVRNLAVYSPTQVKSAIGNRGTFDSDDPDIRHSKREVWYSALVRGIESTQAKSMPPSGWVGQIKSLVNKGQIKADEVEWSGVTDWLGLQQGKVTKEAVLDFVRNNGVRVEETVLGNGRMPALPQGWRVEHHEDYNGFGDGGYVVLSESDEVMGEGETEQEAMRAAADPDEMAGTADTKFDQYTLPGGTNYREVLLKLPRRVTFEPRWTAIGSDGYKSGTFASEAEAREAAGEGGEVERDPDQMKDDARYTSPHWYQPNVLAHIRINDRVDPEGRRVLFVEELQSDWGQEGKKKGFAGKAGVLPAGWTVDQSEVRAYRGGPVIRTEWIVFDNTNTQVGLGAETREEAIANATGASTLGVPSAPFVTSTDKWLALSLKRVIKLAVDEGYDAVAFVNGEQSADRYDLSKQVKSIDVERYDLNGEPVADVRVIGNDGSRVHNEDGASMARIEALIGKDMARRIADQPPETRRQYAGDGLKVGGEGMRAFYDKIVPAVVKDLLRKMGGGQMKVVDVVDGRSRDIATAALGDMPDATAEQTEWQRRYDEAMEAGDYGAVAELEIAGRPEPTEDQASRYFGSKTLPQPGFDITPAMREMAADGMPMFSRRESSAREDVTRRRRELRSAGAAGQLRILRAKLGRLQNERSASGRGDIGAFNLDEYEDYDIETVDMDAAAADVMSDEEMASLNAELQKSMISSAGVNDYRTPSPEKIVAAGLMAETAYKPLSYDGNGDAEVRLKKGRHARFATVREHDGTTAVPQIAFGNERGQALPTGGISSFAAQAYNQRIAASIDLFDLGFDLGKAVDKQAAARVLKTWRRIAKIRGAKEFGDAGDVDTSLPMHESMQTVADRVLGGTKWKATVEPGRANTLKVTLDDGGGPPQEATVHVNQTAKSAVAHTQDLEKGSGAGKAFYQVLFAWAHDMGLRTLADAGGLTGVNLYRRTEQMLAAAARRSEATLAAPGVGQRIYGWERDADAGKRNLVRLALASARNAEEIVPGARRLAYDGAGDELYWRNGENEGESAEDWVRTQLRRADVRAFGVSRSTLVRAAITWSAVEGGGSALPDEFASPIVYSTRGDALPESEWGGISDPAEWTEAAFSAREMAEYLRARNKTLSSINPASVLAEDRERAARAIRVVEKELEALAVAKGIPDGVAVPHDTTSVPIGPMPHTLHMLGAPMQMLQIHSTVLDKVLRYKHADDTAGIAAEKLVESIYKPVIVIKSTEPGRFVAVSGLQGADGPLMFVVQPNAELPNGAKVASIASAYGRRIDGKGDSLVEAARANRVLYVDEARLGEVVGQSPAAKTLRSLFEAGVKGNRIKTPKSLEAFIAARYKGTIDDMPDYSRRGQGRFNLRAFGIGAQFIEDIQDRYNRWKQVIEDVRKQGGAVDETNDFYLAEERFWGRVATRMDDFHEEVKKWVDEVAQDRMTISDVAKYAYALHAKERNAYISQKRGADAWSGMSDQDADLILAEVQASGMEPQFARHAATLRRWIQGTRDILLNEGLIDQDTYDAWDRMFQFYVPLRGLDGVESTRGTGQGHDVRGPEGKRAYGRRSEARQIIEDIVQDRAKALVRAGKNEVAKTFGKFVADNPDPTLWEIEAIENKPFETVDQFGNRIIDERQQIVTDTKRTVSYKDAGREVFIVVHDPKLLEQLKNLNADGMNKYIGALLWANRTLSKLYTALSPVFLLLNGMRDFTAGTLHVIDELGFLAVPRFWANLAPASAESFAAERHKYSRDYQLFRATGGKTGYWDFKTIEGQTKDLQRMLALSEPTVNPAKHAERVFLKTMSLIEALNGGVENTVRLAAFKTARQEGSSVAEAARISKNATVNFNRKGTQAQNLGAFFLFFNPAVQGTTRILEALKNPKVLATVGMGMVGIAALAVRNAAMGDDDDGVAWWDKIPAEVKERNLVIVLPPESKEGEPIKGTKTGRYVKIPMPYGYNWFAVLANQMVDVWRNKRDPKRGVTPVKGATRAAAAFFNAWVPAQELSRSFETPESAIMAAVPDAFAPVAQIIANRSAFGRPISPEDKLSKGMPDSNKVFTNQLGTGYHETAKWINEHTGGSKYKSGLIDVSPGSLETLLRGYGGGPAQFTLDTLNAFYARTHLKRPEMDKTKLPFIKQLYGEIDAETDRATGYARLEDAEKALSPYKVAKSLGDRQGATELREEFGEILRLGSAIEQTRERLSKIRKRELSILSSDKPDEIKFVELSKMDLEKRAALQRFNAVYDRAIVRQHDATQRAEQKRSSQEVLREALR